MSIRSEIAAWTAGILLVAGGFYMTQIAPPTAALTTGNSGKAICKRQLETKWQKSYDAANARYQADLKLAAQRGKAPLRLRDSLMRIQKQYEADRIICQG